MLFVQQGEIERKGIRTLFSTFTRAQAVVSREPTTHAIREEKCLYFFVALREKLLYGIMVALSRKGSKGLNQVDPFSACLFLS